MNYGEKDIYLFSQYQIFTLIFPNAGSFEFKNFGGKFEFFEFGNKQDKTTINHKFFRINSLYLTLIYFQNGY